MLHYNIAGKLSIEDSHTGARQTVLTYLSISPSRIKARFNYKINIKLKHPPHTDASVAFPKMNGGRHSGFFTKLLNCCENSIGI